MTDPIEADIALVKEIEAIPGILDVVCTTTGMGFSAVARVTDRRWVACAVKDDISFGLKPGGELPVETTLCHDIRSSSSAIIIDHVAEDPVYAAHHTPRLYGIQSYASVPIRLKDGSFFGTLCAIDPRPARLKAQNATRMFTLFAELIAFHIDARLGQKQAERSLAEERAMAHLRDQFIAILGHDLRNPLASINSGVRLLSRAELDERSRGIIGLIQGSVVRMSGLIDNMLDYARGTLGGGIEIRSQPTAGLEAALMQVVDEVRMAHPDQRFAVTMNLAGGIDCDEARLAQLLSNLLSNALTHGAVGGPVSIDANDDGGVLSLTVSNPADPFPDEFKARLFKPFSRLGPEQSTKSLGLGLFIADEIAKAHGGRMTFEERGGEARFTFTMPTDRVDARSASR